MNETNHNHDEGKLFSWKQMPFVCLLCNETQFLQSLTCFLPRVQHLVFLHILPFPECCASLIPLVRLYYSMNAVRAGTCVSILAFSSPLTNSYHFSKIII